MARKRKRTQINLTINFGQRVYQDSMTSLYEAKDTVTGNRLLVLITDDSFQTPTSIDVAQEIRKKCDKINVASIEIPSLFPILDSGLLDDSQAFFMSSVPNSTPLIRKEFSSVEEVIDLVESMVKIISLVHSLDLTQVVFNLESEWYYSDDNLLTLIFPGVRGLLGKLSVDSGKGNFQSNKNQDLVELCKAFDKLLKQVGVEVSIPKLNIVTRKLHEFKDNIDFEVHSVKSFILFLKTLREALSHFRESSLPTIQEDVGLGMPDFKTEKVSPDLSETKNEEGESIYSNDKDERLDELLSSFISPNQFTDMLHSNLDSPRFNTPSTSSYIPPKVEVFEASSKNKKPKLSEDNSVSRKFSNVADTVYGNKSNKSGLKKKLEDGSGESAKKGLYLFLIALLLIIVIIALLYTIYSELTSQQELSKPAVIPSDSLQIFDSGKGMLPEDQDLQNVEADNASGNIQLIDPIEDNVPIENLDKNNTSKLEDSAQFLTLDQEPVSDGASSPKDYLESLVDPIPLGEVSKVISHLESEDFEIRIIAIRTLGEKAPKNDLRTRIAIESMLNDKDTLVRGFAAFALVSYSGQGALPILEDRLTFEKNEVVSTAISRAISKLK
jgi:hypothetical protein